MLRLQSARRHSSSSSERVARQAWAVWSIFLLPVGMAQLMARGEVSWARETRLMCRGEGVWACLVASASLAALNWLFPLAVNPSGVSALVKGRCPLAVWARIAAMRPSVGRVHQRGFVVCVAVFCGVSLVLVLDWARGGATIDI